MTPGKGIFNSSMFVLDLPCTKRYTDNFTSGRFPGKPVILHEPHTSRVLLFSKLTIMNSVGLYMLFTHSYFNWIFLVQPYLHVVHWCILFTCKNGQHWFPIIAIIVYFLLGSNVSRFMFALPKHAVVPAIMFGRLGDAWPMTYRLLTNVQLYSLEHLVAILNNNISFIVGSLRGVFRRTQVSDIVHSVLRFG